MEKKAAREGVCPGCCHYGVDPGLHGRYLWAMHLSPNRLLRLLLVALVSWVCPFSAAADEASAVRPAEYMIYQYPNVSLVIVVDVREAQFASRIEGPEGALITEASVPGRRIGPVYQLVEAVARPRQLMIEVNPERRIERSRISMELLQLPDSDRNALALTRAYRFLAHGMKSASTDTSAAWAARIYSLRNASQAFASLGMEEMTLWSEHFAAHLTLHGLGDQQLAMERARAVRTAARRAGFETVGFAAAVLEAEAFMAAAGAAQGDAAIRIYRSANELWSAVTNQAASLGFEAEQGRALFQDGVAYEQQGRLDEAVQRYEEALAVTSAASDLDLLNQIRATTAAAYEQRGSTGGAIELLEEIASGIDSSAGAADQELAVNLYEKGRLLNSTFRYRQASLDLERSLELQAAGSNDVYRGLAGLELARAYRALGETDKARSIGLRSISWLPRSSSDSRAAALGLLAAMARENGHFDEMSDFRSRQGEWLTAESSRAAFLFESALDAIEKEGLASSAAERLLREAQRKAAGSDLLSGHRAALYLCLVQLRLRGSGACEPERVESSHEALRRGGVPAIAVDAGLAWVAILESAGRDALARAAAERLLDDVQFYREFLPGAIVSWYAEHRARLYELHLSLARRVSATAYLLALNRVRDVEHARIRNRSDGDGVRGAIARVVAAQPTPDDALSRQAHRELKTFRDRSNWASDAIDEDRLRRILEELGPDENILVYVFSGQRLDAVKATADGVALQRLSGAERVRDHIRNVRMAMQDPAAPAPLDDLEALGRLLFTPLEEKPGRRLYLMPFGPLNGFPFDALHTNGRFLAETHRVVNLGSLAALESPPPAPDTGPGASLFLAGNPRSNRALFTYDVSTSAEIAAVRDRFVGAGLHIVQGVALRGDEFEDERYAEAGVVHLAMPGRVDLVHPERSRLLLSGERETPNIEFLSSERLGELPLTARLAVLSGTAFTGSPVVDFDSRLGLIEDLHHAGAAQVVASLWPAGDAENADLMGSFYGELQRRGSVPEALHEVRKSRIASKNGTNLRGWAGFQLFIR